VFEDVQLTGMTKNYSCMGTATGHWSRCSPAPCF
jgi:hypothetical protein